MLLALGNWKNSTVKQLDKSSQLVMVEPLCGLYSFCQQCHSTDKNTI